MAAPRVALVHDWLNQHGGAERVLEHLTRLFPGAPVFTSIYWRAGMPETYAAWDIRPHWIDRLPGIHTHHQAYFPFFALAFGSLRIRGDYDVVLSNKSGFCHAVDSGAVPHLCYCLAPTRYVWEFDAYAEREALPGWAKALIRPAAALLRRWDYAVAQRPTTHYVAISREIQQRIRAYYDRDSVIIHPPVDIERYAPATSSEGYYLVVSRLVPYKRIDLAVQAFTALGLPLLVAGDGRDRGALERMAGPTVRFLGRVEDTALPGLFARCKAFVFPGREDFGIAPLEAQASGRPVIAYAAGGALETVIDGVTGAFFTEPTAEALAEAVLRFDAAGVDPAACRRNAERFSPEQFRQRLIAEIATICG
jgi:glycosyltransferase involved in cell wall biosynthesis